ARGERGLGAGGVATMIRGKYSQALWGAEKANVAVEGLGDVSINIQQSVRNATATGGAQAADAATAAGTAVGGPGGPATFFGLPLIVPPSGLIGQLMAIPSTWGTAGSALEAGVTPAAFSAKVEGILKVTGAAESIARLVGLGPAEVTKHRDLYTRAYGMVNSAAA